jgi:hypothetical protein
MTSADKGRWLALANCSSNPSASAIVSLSCAPTLALAMVLEAWTRPADRVPRATASAARDSL